MLVGPPGRALGVVQGSSTRQQLRVEALRVVAERLVGFRTRCPPPVLVFQRDCSTIPIGAWLSFSNERGRHTCNAYIYPNVDQKLNAYGRDAFSV